MGGIWIWVFAAAFLFLSSSAYAKNDGSLLDEVEAARAVGVPASTVNRLLASAYESKEDPDDIRSILALLTRAAEEKLPLQPLVDKLNEGLGKRVPLRFIKRALEKKKEEYALVYRVLADHRRRLGKKEEVAPREVAGFAECLDWGLKPDELEAFLNRFPQVDERRLLPAFETYAVLRQNRFDRELALQVVETAVVEEWNFSNRSDLYRLVVAAGKKGRSAQETAGCLISGLQHRETPVEMAGRLGLTERDLTFGPRVAPGGSGGSRSVHSNPPRSMAPHQSHKTDFESGVRGEGHDGHSGEAAAESEAESHAEGGSHEGGAHDGGGSSASEAGAETSSDHESGGMGAGTSGGPGGHSSGESAGGDGSGGGHGGDHGGGGGHK